MTYFAYIFYMIAGTIMAGSVWLWTVFSINPSSSGLLGILLFYISFILMLIGIFALLGILVRVLIFRHYEMRVVLVRTTFRQAILLAVLAESMLILQKYGFLTWWSFMLLFLLVISLEFFFSAGHHI